MCEEIIRNAAPTLAGLKTGSLFTVCYSDKIQVLHELAEVNSTLACAGLLAVPMRFSENRVLIYVYRINALKNDFNDPNRSRLLMNLGYSADNTVSSINELRRRITSSESFPHEIGLFLGYPTEDVMGFIRCSGKNYKLLGTWKVYGNEQSAQKQFDRFKKCTRNYIEQYNKGTSFKRLVVA